MRAVSSRPPDGGREHGDTNIKAALVSRYMREAQLAPSRVASATPSARSFSRIRFSGRIGGVLIGISPTQGGDALDVRELS